MQYFAGLILDTPQKYENMGKVSYRKSGKSIVYKNMKTQEALFLIPWDRMVHTISCFVGLVSHEGYSTRNNIV